MKIETEFSASQKFWGKFCIESDFIKARCSNLKGKKVYLRVPYSNIFKIVFPIIRKKSLNNCQNYLIWETSQSTHNKFIHEKQKKKKKKKNIHNRIYINW